MPNKITPEVMAMNGINFSGNVIPTAWYGHLHYDSGKPNLNAIIILSEIVYWYRPSEVRDEKTGQLMGYKKKFKADKLQRSHQSFSTQFGFTKKQVRDALGFLENKGLITKELRTIRTQGISMSNVLFIGIVPAKIKAITLQVIPMTLKSHPINIEVTPSLPESQTYTENTTEISTENGLTPQNPQQTKQKIDPDFGSELDLWFQNPNSQTNEEDTATRLIEDVWQKRIAQTTKQALLIYYLAMAKVYPETQIPRDQSTQGKWAAAAKDHLDNYSLAELEILYPLAIKHAQANGWEIYSPHSLTSALAKVKSQGPSRPSTDYQDDPQYQAFAEDAFDGE